MKRRLRIALIATALLLTLSACSFLIYASDYYKADDMAKSVMQSASVTRALDNLLVLSPAKSFDTAMVFYPGAKVEFTAYLPLLEKISQRCGITCILVRMPFNMAIFNTNAADEAFGLFPDIKNWYIAGHSMGGAMASAYASKHQDRIKGLILLGAYIYGNYPAEKALTIYGSFNSTVAEKVDYSENVVVIDGGNHAQFGNYGKQKGDPDAAISRDEQQEAAVEAIRDFLAR